MANPKAVLEHALGDLSEWLFTGRVVYVSNDDLANRDEVPRCVCGKGIAYLFTIKRCDEIAIVGSECVRHFRRPWGVRKPKELAEYAKWDYEDGRPTGR